MKRYLSIIMLAVAAFVAAPQVSAYNEDVAELAKLLNAEAGKDGITVNYDGTDIIMNFPASMFSDEERELFAVVDNLQPLAPVMIQAISQSLGAENMDLFGSILSNTGTNLVIRLDLGDKTSDIKLTGEDFLNN